MNVNYWRCAAWLLLAAVVLMTLGPIGLRPHSGVSVNFERFAAFAAIGLVFAMAYPQRRWLVALVVLGSAIGLEAMQFFALGRHAGLPDLIAKLAGGSIGVATGWAMVTLRSRLSSPDNPG